jgi:hypothetical protein
METVQKYSRRLQNILVETAEAALTNLQPAQLEHGVSRATFAMNRRIYREDRIDFGENPEGPVDWEVPVLKIKGANDSLRAVLFGYACHGTSIAGDDFYLVSGDYMGYARQHLETLYPGVVVMYVTGMGADSNPSPRGRLLDAKRHGVELAGAVIGILNHPMRPVRGAVRLAYAEADLPFVEPPSREQIEKEAQHKDVHIRNRAEAALKLLNSGKPLPQSIPLPMAAARIGDDLTFVMMGGEVVVDYALRFKRMFAHDHAWMIGYAYTVPGYIPSVRILKEGGYEAHSAWTYYGFYGPFSTRVEDVLLKKMTELVTSVRGR